LNLGFCTLATSLPVIENFKYFEVNKNYHANIFERKIRNLESNYLIFPFRILKKNNKLCPDNHSKQKEVMYLEETKYIKISHKNKQI
jgi:hypothetical protein